MDEPIDLTPRECKVYDRLVRSRAEEGFLSRSRLTHSLAYLGSAKEVVEIAESLVRKGIALSRPSRTGAICYSLIPVTSQFLEFTEVVISKILVSEGTSICPLCHGDGYVLKQKFEEFRERVLGLEVGSLEEPVQINEGSISELLGGGNDE